MAGNMKMNLFVFAVYSDTEFTKSFTMQYDRNAKKIGNVTYSYLFFG